MKSPNKLLNKKYISSLAVAAFLILSVLTAYNIKIDRSNPEETNTQTEETARESEEAMNQADGQNPLNEQNREKSEKEESGNDDENTGSQTDDERESDSQSEKESEENNDSAVEKEDTEKEDKDKEESDEEDTENDDTDSEDKTKKYSYDGKTKLSWPVMGNVILPYSMDTTVYYTTLDHYACNDGLLIGAKVGDEVVAAADGRVVNISDSDRYGTTVTILIGDYYEMEYAQVTDLKCEIGDEVEEGQIIAAVAEPTRAFGLEGPHLFLKMTCKGEAVNPTDYLK